MVKYLKYASAQKRIDLLKSNLKFIFEAHGPFSKWRHIFFVKSVTSFAKKLVEDENRKKIRTFFFLLIFIFFFFRYLTIFGEGFKCNFKVFLKFVQNTHTRAHTCADTYTHTHSLTHTHSHEFSATLSKKLFQIFKIQFQAEKNQEIKSLGKLLIIFFEFVKFRK